MLRLWLYRSPRDEPGSKMKVGPVIMERVANFWRGSYKNEQYVLSPSLIAKGFWELRAETSDGHKLYSPGTQKNLMFIIQTRAENLDVKK
jgi:hypothetical protein